MKYQKTNIFRTMSLFLILLFLVSMSASITHAETYSFVTKWGSYGNGDGQFVFPYGIAAGSDGIYITDVGNHCVQKFDSDGTYVTKWGSEGSGNGQFINHYGVAVDSSGNVFIADSDNNRIQKFDRKGGFLTAWGSSGTSDGEFNTPCGIAVDSSENVYVADLYNNRIQKFDSNGKFITKWGSEGSGNGQFSNPYGVAVDSSDNVYVADTQNNRIQKFDSNGEFLTTWGSSGTSDGEFNIPKGIAVDSSDNVYVADTQNNRIQKFNSNGTFITKWGSAGDGDGQFRYPYDVAVDSSGNVYVADTSNSRIQKFAVNNTPVDNIDTVPYAYVTAQNNYPDNYGTVTVINTATNKVTATVPVGSAPNGIAVTPDRTKVYVANMDSDTVSVIDTATNTVISTVDVGSVPSGVAINPDGTKVYVTNYYSNTASVIDTYTNTVTATVDIGDCPNGIAVNSDGKKIYVANGVPYPTNRGIVSVIDSTTNTVTATVDIGSYPSDIAVTPDGKYVYVTESSNNTVSVIDTSTNTVTAIVNVREAPLGVAVSPDGKYVYVANSDRGIVSVIDTSTNTVIDSVSVGGGIPVDIAITSDGKKVYVTNFDSQKVFVIDTSTNTVTATVSVGLLLNNIAISQFPESPQTALPVSNFTSNITEGNAPLNIQFTDLSKNATGWSWDFDNDGIIDSTKQNPSYTYSSAGTYTVNLTVSNAYGNNNEVKTDFIVVSTPENDTTNNTDDKNYSFVTKWGSSGSGQGQFYYPQGVAVDSSGNVYISDTVNNRIQKFASNGNFIAKWGSYGTGNGQFYYPRSIAIDSSDNVYVADTNNNRIQKFDSAGNFITSLGSSGNGNGQLSIPLGVAVDSSDNVYVADYNNSRIQKFASNGSFITKWGTQGSGNGQFISPIGIAVDSSDNVYVADTSRIQKFGSNGNFIAQWGSYGTGDGQLSGPQGLAIDSSGNIFVTDTGNHRVQLLDSNGEFITKWGSNGSANGQFDHPVGIAVDSSGNVYVADTYNNRIQKFAVKNESEVSGLPVANFTCNIIKGYSPVTVQFSDSSLNETGLYWDFGDGSGSSEKNPVHIYSIAGNYTVNLTISNGNLTDTKLVNITVLEGYKFSSKFGSYGSGEGQLDHPHDVAVDSSGNIFVADTGNHLIQMFDSNGIFHTQWGSQGNGEGQFYNPCSVAVDSSGNVYVADESINCIQKFSNSGAFITKWGSYGTGDGQFYCPTGVAVDSSGNVYVADYYNNRIQKFSSNGTFVTKWGSEGEENGSFDYPYDVAVDSSGNVYVADEGNNRIQKFDSSGTFITKWGYYGTGSGQFNGPRGLAVDSSRNVYVIDYMNNRIQMFDSNGSYLAQWGSLGKGDGQFSYPLGIAVDSSDNVYVADPNNNCIQKFAINKESEVSELPIANFTSSVTQGYIPLSVQFIDGSLNETGLYWDFGDGTNSTEKNPVHTYYTAGNYTVNLTVSNGNLTDTKLATITVLQGYTFNSKLGSYGSGQGQFYYPCDVAVDSSGNIYVADTQNNRIQKFDSNWNYLAKWGSYGTGDGQFNYPRGIAVDSSGNVYVADYNNNRIQEFTSDGTFITKWGSSGTGDGQFKYPSDVTVDSSGIVYVADSGNNRIQEFNSNGNLIFAKWGSQGSGNGQFNSPQGIAVDLSDNVYVADSGNNRIQKFSSNGTFITKWGSLGSVKGQFKSPGRVTVDSSGNVYVADTQNNRIQEFTSNGIFITKWGSYGTGNGQFNNPSGIATDSSGNIYVADTYNNRIQKFAIKKESEVSGLPVANFTINFNQGYTPFSVQFTDRSLNETGLYWDFGDGSGSTEKNPVHTYTTAGNYTANLTVNNGNLTDTKSAMITVLEGYTFSSMFGSTGSGQGQFNFPYDVAVDSSGNIYVADHSINRIQKFDSNWNYLTQWGSYGSGNGQFKSPQGVAVDSSGNVYVADYYNNRVQKFASNGEFITKWGSSGNGDGQFKYPSNIAVDSSGNVYVADYGNNRIQKFTNNGTFTTKWGFYGTGNGQFNYPYGVAVDSSGNVYVVDSGNNRIQEFNSNGTFITQWGSQGSGNGQFNSPRGVAVDSSGNVFVADTYNHMIQMFDSDGNYHSQWGSYGTENGQFNNPSGVATDSSGNIYVADTDNNRIQKFAIKKESEVSGLPVANFTINFNQGYTPFSVQFTDRSLNETGLYWDFGDGSGSTEKNPVHTYTTAGNYTANLTVNNGNLTDTKSAMVTVLEGYTFSSMFGSTGSGQGQFNFPYDVAVDSSGNIYVADYSNNRIQKFDSNWNYLTQWGSYGSGNGQFKSPQGVAVDSSGNVYVADYYNNRVQKFASNGEFITKWGSSGNGDGQFKYPSNIAVDSSGNVYVADYGNNRIQKFTNNGTFTTKWGSEGSNNRQFNYPYGVAVDSSGNVYVVDSGNNRIQKFDSNGTFITKWGSYGRGSGQLNSPRGVAVDSSGNVFVADTYNHMIQMFDSDGNYHSQWGSYGIENGQFYTPSGVATDSSGNIYVADTYNNRIQKFAIKKESEVSGLPVANFTTNFNSGYTPFSVQFTDRSLNETGLFWDFGDGSGSNEKNPVHTYTTAGNYTVNLTVSNGNLTDTKLATITVLQGYTFNSMLGSYGRGQGQFNYPCDVAVDSSGIIYVADTQNNRIQKFDSNWNYLAQWGSQGSGDGQFYYPLGIAVDSSGNVYVADYYNNRIQEFASNGTFITKWGSQGSGNGQFNYPSCIAIDSLDDVYVADTNNNRIQKFNSNGTFITKWGSSGTDNGQFYRPSGVAVDLSGNVYVADTYNNRIQEFTNYGTFITKWGSQGKGYGQFYYPSGVAVDSSGNVFVADTYNHMIQTFDSNGSYHAQWGSYGTGNGQFNDPFGVAVDSSGNVYVADQGNNRIQKFTIKNESEVSWLPVANFTINFNQGYTPFSVQFTDSSLNETGLYWDFGDGSGSTEKNPVHTYTAAGNYTANLTVINGNLTDSKSVMITVLEGYAFSSMFGSSGSGQGQFNNTRGVAVDSSGNIYVADYSNNRIQKFDSNWNYLTQWGSYGTGDGLFKYPRGIAVDSLGKVYVADTQNNRIQEFTGNGTFITKWGSQGSGNGQFNYPSGVAVDSVGNVYVADQSNNRIQEFTGNGTFITKWGSQGSGNGQFNYPSDVAVDSSGNVYVADQSNNRIQEFTSTGIFITRWGSYGTGPGQFIYPQGVAVDLWGYVYVADASNNRIQMFDSNHNCLSQWGSFGSDEGEFNYPSGIAVDSSDNVYVADTQNNRIQKFAIKSELEKNGLPVANFTCNVTQGYAPLSVQFTDSSMNETGLYWDFGDGANSTEKNPVHTYTVAGNYTATLTINNGRLTNSKLATITVNANPVTPPQSLSNIQFTNGITWLNWTWTSPTDPSFNHTEIYLNGIFQKNVTVGYFNATELQPETNYTLGTRTADNYGNVNETWVNSTATTGAETINESINVSISTDKLTYNSEETVHITGNVLHLDGSPVVNSPALLEINIKGYTKTFSLETDSNGNISYDLKPGPTEAGSTTAKLRVNSNGNWISAETSFNMYGLYMTPSGAVNCEVVKNSSKNISFSLNNYGDLDLHGVTAQIYGDNIPGVETQILQTPPDTLVAGAQELFMIEISSTNMDISQANYTVKVTTDEGSYQEANLIVNFADANPTAVVTPTLITIGVNPGNNTLKTVTVANTGYGSMNDINISKPSLDWVSVSATNLGNIYPNMNKSFNIFFSPNKNTSIGVYQDTITISSSNHAPVDVHLTISVTSSEKGDLVFHVINDIGQNISGASIVIQNPAVPTEIFTGATDQNGYYTFKDCSAGTYNYFITASDYDQVSGSSTVFPGIQTQAEPVLSTDILGVKFTVTPIKINDTYDVLMNFTFETDVPPPRLITGNIVTKTSGNGNITIYNSGLVSIFDVTVNSPSLEGADVTFPTGYTYSINEIKGQSSVTIPYHITVTDPYNNGENYRGSIEVKGHYLTFEPNSDVTQKVYLASEIPVFIPEVDIKYFGSGGEGVYKPPSASYSPIPIVETAHERVKFNIPQESTLERDGFAASLELTNKLSKHNIENMHVNLVIKDKDGNDASNLFFTNLTSLNNINSVDGSGIVSPLSVADVNWLLVPKLNAGGTDPLGKDYLIQALISYTVNGVSYSVDSTEESITVMPQPLLDLNYTIPENVKANTPFNLTLNVTNVGYGVAKGVKFDSGQPVIYENKAGLLINISLISSGLVGEPENNSMLIDFGHLAPGESKEAYWTMETSLEGSFTEFKGSFTHNNALGGAETSLINDIKYTIVPETDVNSPSPTPDPIMPVANFTYNATEGPMPLTVQFNDTSENAERLNWNFGDNNVSDEKNPKHTFYTAGNYTVDLTAINENSTDTRNYTIRVNNTFLPYPNGYSFKNSNNLIDWLNDNIYTPENSPDDFYNTYGQRVDANNPDLKVTKFYVNYFKNMSKGGNCFGMSSSSLLLYDNGVTDVYSHSSTENLLDNWKGYGTPYYNNYPTTLGRWIISYQTLQFDKACMESKAQTDKSTYAILSQHLLSGLNDMVLNIYWQGDNSEKLSGHALVPYKIVEDVDKQCVDIYVYDSNHPKNDTLYIKVDPKNKLVYNYDSHPIESWNLISLNAIKKMPNIPYNFFGILHIDSNDNTHLNFKDNVGGVLGYENGVFKDEIPNACPVIPTDGETNESSWMESYYVPDSSLKMELHGGSNSISDVSMITLNGCIDAEVPVSPASVDEFKVLNNGTGVYFNSENSNTPYLGLMLDVETTEHAQIIHANFSQIEKGGSVNISNDNGTITIKNNGLSRTCYMFIEQITNDQNSSATVNNIVIEADSTIYAEPSDWENLSGSTVTIKHDVGSDGTIDSTEIAGQQNSLVLPVSNFTANVTEGNAPLSVQFTDLSENATEWSWDFDNDGIIDSTEKNPSYTYSLTGTYSVNLTVANTGGNDSEIKTDYIVVSTPETQDTTVPAINSVVLYPANTTAGSKINITVNATDNIGVVGVTAGNVQLTNTGSLWQGTITAPSKIGSYPLLINASDAAGNSANKTENYRVVSPTGSLGVGISPKTTTASTSGKTIDYTVKIKSIQNFDDTVRVKVTMDGLPANYQVPLEWFDWNNQTVTVASNNTISLPLRLTIPSGQSVGRKAFKVSANSTSWITTAFDSGVITIS